MNNTFMTQFYNIHLETDVLGVMLSYKEEVDTGMLLLDVDCFSEVKNKVVYSAIKKLWQDEKTIDISTVYNLISKEVSLSYLMDLVESGLKAGFKEKCNELIRYKQKYQLYKLINKANDMFKREESFANILATVNDHTEELITKRENKMTTAYDLLGKSIANLDKRREEGGGIIGIPTGFSGLDNAINGLKRKEVIIIAGRPAMGKSTIANNIALNVVKSGNSVAMFSLEMAKEQIADKLLSTITLTAADKVAKAKVSEIDIKEMESIRKQREELKKFYIFDDTTTLNSIVATCKMLKKKGNLDVLIVDYLQLADSEKSGNREQEISHISRTLRRLASTLDITVIALSQLSRNVEQRPDKRPMMSDLRESGAIEQDANTIIMCYRDEYYNSESEDKNIFEAIIVKNRGGENKTIKLAWLPEYQKIAELELKREEGTVKKDWEEVQDEFPF